MNEPDPYYYARDHARGPGAWCVRGPADFQIDVPDKMIAFAIGKFLSGKRDEAEKMLADWVKYTKDACDGR